MGTLATVVGTSVVTYVIYKRFEPTGPLSAFILLFLLPGIALFQVKAQYVTVLGAVATVYPLHWSLTLFYILAYRLSPFHPLAEFPGPLPCKLSKFWMAFVTYQGNAHRYVRKLHAIYGDVVRIGPNELSFNNASVVTPILGPKGLNKGPYYDTRQQEDATGLDGLRDRVEHAIRRKAWMKATSVAALKGYEELLRSDIHELIDCLSKMQGKRLDISLWITLASIDFMGQMAFSTDFGMMKAGKDSNVLHKAMNQGTFEAGVISHVPWTLQFLNHLPKGQAFRFLKNLGADIVRQRIQKGSTRRDLFHYLMDEDGVEIYPPSVTADGMLAIIAGSKTSAIALSHVFYFLLRHPQCLQRLQKEIDDAFPRGDDPTHFTKQADMLYLNACINEALRLYPPALIGLQRRVELGVGHQQLGNYIVPEGTQVSAHLFSTQRDPRYFSPIPNEFWPDRWLNQDLYTLPSGTIILPEDVINTKDIFLPFSIGSQNCPGKSIALMKMRAYLCAIIQQFEFAPAEDFRMESWEENIVDVYITHHGPLFVNLTSR